jgi:hypothetical protein
MDDAREGGERTAGGGAAPVLADIGPDMEVQQMVEQVEAERKAREAAEGRGVQVVEYTPHAEVPRVGSRARLVVAILLMFIMIIPALYFVAIPRADAELVIEYNEGVVGGINVDARIENSGTRTLEDVKVTILVQNSTDVRMAEPSQFTGQVSAHNNQGMDAISFNGDQWDTYHIFVEYSFDCAGQTYHGTEHFITKGEGMNKWYHLDMTG